MKLLWFGNHLPQQVRVQKKNIFTPLQSCSVNDMPVTVRRPRYPVLENNALKMVNLDRMPAWDQGLVSYLRKHVT